MAMLGTDGGAMDAVSFRGITSRKRVRKRVVKVQRQCRTRTRERSRSGTPCVPLDAVGTRLFALW
jgi:hypothetical protein